MLESECNGSLHTRDISCSMIARRKELVDGVTPGARQATAFSASDRQMLMQVTGD